ncbi:MAG: VapE domain-containing protein [Steroidobacteraceae bacterium]
MADKITRLDLARDQLDRQATQPRGDAADNGADHDWRADLAPSGTGFLGDERNVLIALRGAPELAGLVRFNEFALQVEFSRSSPWRQASPGDPWRDEDDTQLAEWLQAASLKVRGTGAIGGCIAVAAREYSYHPVRDYLASLTWDGEPRLQIWLADYLNAQADPVYLNAVGRKFMTSAIARILQPGCQADHVLVLEAAQGAGKTSAARSLAVHPAWFAGNLPEVTSKDATMQLCGRWIIEIAELKAIRTSQIEATKTFLTQCVDTFRPPYGRRTGQFPRQCVFIGTTNESTYLRDRTGNRRYWPVKCGRIEVPALIRDRDQLWAEAVQLYRTDSVWHLTDEEAQLATAEQQERLEVSQLEEDVRVYLSQQTNRREITVREVLIDALHLDPDLSAYSETARKLGPAVAAALEACGWQKIARIGRDKRTTYRRGQG